MSIVVRPVAEEMKWSPLVKVSANILIFLLNFVVSDEVMVVDPSMMAMV